jgi:L-aspartate oxidase
MDSITCQTCDILIVGSGLAGLCAGIAAQSCNDGLDVCLATPRVGPSGSSFTNPNRALGMVVCHNDREKDVFLNTACAMAAPGFIDPSLTAILADESETLYDDLRETGLALLTDESGHPRRHSACFLKTPPLAYVFTDLFSTFFRLKQRFLRDGRMWEGLRLLDLVVNEERRVIGALFRDLRSGEIRAVQCRALIMATGGGAALFSRNLTDPDNLGHGLALMHRAGAALVNMNYLQYMWYEKGTHQFWPCGQIAEAGWRIVDPSGQVVTVPEQLGGHASQRFDHAPVAHGRPDAALDDYLLSMADETGLVTVRDPNGVTLSVCLYAHAFNGGARIDSWGQTDVPGLLACGECSGGMHGANRVGGAMVLSSQVFGRRAGLGAVRWAREVGLEPENRFLHRARFLQQDCRCDDKERFRALHDLGLLLSTQAGSFPRPDREGCLDRIKVMARSAVDHDLALALSCARLIVEKRP